MALLVMVTGFAVIYGFLKLTGKADLPALLWVAGGILIISALVPAAGRFILKIWFGLAHVLGWVNSRILLSLIYFLILTPIALLYRIFTGDQLHFKSPPKDTMFVEREHNFTSKDLENPW